MDLWTRPLSFQGGSTSFPGSISLGLDRSGRHLTDEVSSVDADLLADGADLRWPDQALVSNRDGVQPALD